MIASISQVAEMAKSTSGTIIKVLNSNNLEPPQFNGKKDNNYIIWMMKFKEDQVMKGLYEAFQPNLEQELPSDKKVKLDLTDKSKKKQHNAVKKNQKVMMQLALSFSNVSLLNKLNARRRRTRNG